MAHVRQLSDRDHVARVQYRALSPGATNGARNQTRKVSIPLDMVAALGWSSDWPVRVTLLDAGIELVQVGPPAALGLVLQHGIWVPVEQVRGTDARHGRQVLAK